MASTDAHPSAQATYHVRIICPWASSSPSQTSTASFFGLELELRGFSASGDPVVVFPVDTDGDHETKRGAHPSLSSIVGPFQLVVRSKQASDAPNLSEQQADVLQRVVTVQPGNLLVEINNVRFLRSSQTASAVVAQLRRMSRCVSLGRPFTLTLERHNHAQASAKIVPFAARSDVQAAQLAQFDRLQEQERSLGEHIKRKKHFILQQLDYEREHYLYDHIGMQLHELHGNIMARGLWQAYEFERALWYFHAPSRSLFAEHPMRNDRRTRQLIGSALLRTRFAVIKLQRGARGFLRRAALAERVVSDPRLLDAVWTQSLWLPMWETLWRTELGPLMDRKTPRVLNVGQEADRVLATWRGARRQQTKTANSRTAAFTLSFRGFPDKKAGRTDGEEAPVAKTTVSAATSARKAELSDASMMTEPLSPRAPVTKAPTPRQEVVGIKSETTSTAVGSARASVFDSGTQSDTLRLSRFDAGTQVDLAQVEEAVQAEMKTPQRDAEMQTDSVEALGPIDETKGGGNGESTGEWRSYLHILKTNLVKKKQHKSPVHRSTQTEFPRSNDGGRAAPRSKKRPSVRQKSVSKSLEHDRLQRFTSSASPQQTDSFSEYCRSLAFPQWSPEVGGQNTVEDDQHLEELSWRQRMQMAQQQQLLTEERFLLPEYDEASPMLRVCKSLPAPGTLRSAGFDSFDRPDARFRRALDSLLAHDLDLGEHTIEHSSSNSSLLDIDAVRHDQGRQTVTNYGFYHQQQPAAPLDVMEERRIPVPVRHAKSPPITTSVPPVYLQLVKELEQTDGRHRANASLTKLPYITRKSKPR